MALNTSQSDEILNTFQVSCSGIAIYSSLETISLAIVTFKRYDSVYFWSIFACAFGCLLFILGFFDLFYKWYLFQATTIYRPLIVVTFGWYGMVTGFSIVAYSRLRLIKVPEKYIRFISRMIAFNFVVTHSITTVFTFGYNSNPNEIVWTYGYDSFEKIQMSFFCLQEIILGGFYLHFIQKLPEIKKTPLVKQTIVVNSIVLALDVSMLVVEYIGLYRYQIALKAVTYAIKLKLEFYILHLLTRSLEKIVPTKPSPVEESPASPNLSVRNYPQVKTNAISSVYMKTESDMPSPTHEDMVIEIGNDETILTRKFFFSFITDRFLFFILLILCVNFLLDLLILCGEIDPLLSLFVFLLNFIVFTFLVNFLISIPILKKHVFIFGIWLRIVLLLLFVGFTLTVLIDIRCISLIGQSLIWIIGMLFTDAFTKEGHGWFEKFLLLFTSISFLKYFILLQFDLIKIRSNFHIDIGLTIGFHFATFQTARDFCFGCLTIIIKDLYLRWKYPNRFLHLFSPVNVKVVGMKKKNRQKDGVTDDNEDYQRKNKHISLKIIQNENQKMVLLKEKHSVLVRMTGVDRGEQIIKFLGNPFIRSVNNLCFSIPIIIFNCLILPGIISVNYSYLLFFTIIPLIRSFLYKDIRLISILVYQFDFLIDLISSVAILIILGIMFSADTRIVFIPILFCIWMDIRLNDARCIFYHSAYRGKDYALQKQIHTQFFLLFTGFLNIISLATLPIVLGLGAASNLVEIPDFNIRNVNMTMSDEQGAYAEIRWSQFVIDFTIPIALTSCYIYLIDSLRSTKSMVYLRYFQTPYYFKFVTATDRTQSKLKQATKAIKTVHSYEEEEEDGVEIEKERYQLQISNSSSKMQEMNMNNS